MKEILPTQFNEEPGRVRGSLLEKMCNAINALRLTLGWGLKFHQTGSGMHVEVDPDQIKDPQIKYFQVLSIQNPVDGSYPETVLAAPAGNKTSVHVVSIATPFLRDKLLDTPASENTEYDNAYDEYVDRVWRVDGAMYFVGYRLSAPTGNFAKDSDGNTTDVYWLAETARVEETFFNELAGDPWISLSREAVDTGETNDEGEAIYTQISNVNHRRVEDDLPELEYDTAQTGSTDQTLSLVNWANPNLTITPVTLAQDDAGHIHTFTAGTPTVANLAGASDELVASQAGQVAGFLDDVLRPVANAGGDTHLTTAAVGADVEITHIGPGAAVDTLIPMGSYTAPDAATLRLAGVVTGIPKDTTGHINDAGLAAGNRDIILAGDAWVGLTASAAGNNGTITGAHANKQATTDSQTLLKDFTLSNSSGSVIVEFDRQTVRTDAKGHNDTIAASAKQFVHSATSPLTVTAAANTITHAIDWTAITGYVASASVKQVLVNDNGTIKWVDTAECP